MVTLLHYGRLTPITIQINDRKHEEMIHRSPKPIPIVWDCANKDINYPLPKLTSLVNAKQGFKIYVYDTYDIVSKYIKLGGWETIYDRAPPNSSVVIC